MASANRRVSFAMSPFRHASNRWYRARNAVHQFGVLLRVLKLRYFRLLINKRKHLITTACILFLMNSAWHAICRVQIRDPLITETYLSASKCPACVGRSLCKAVLKDISFDCFAYVFLSAPVVVHSGVYDDERILLENLGNAESIRTMERTMCSLVGEGSSECNVTDVALKVELDAELNNLLKLTVGLSTMTTCPTKRLIERIADKYLEKYDPVKLEPIEQVQLLATLLVNPDPIVFQTFSQYDRFPFRLYIGACGSHMVTRVQGEPLRTFYGASWFIRLRIALHLLRTAMMFTENETRFALYWKDISFDSFTYCSISDVLYVTSGKDIIVVDKLEIEESRPVGWDKPIYSQFQNCSDDCSRHCSVTVPNGLCSAKTADHNYYAVCRHLLSSYACQANGRRRSFLHDIPYDVEEEFYPVRELLNECAQPSVPGSREILVYQLIDAMQLIIQVKMSF